MLLLVQQVLQTGKRVMGSRRNDFLLRRTVQNLLMKLGVFVVMAIQAQQFPVAAIRRVVVVVVVFVVNRELTQVGTGEFTRTAATNPREQFECAFAVALFALGVAFGSVCRHG